MEYWSVEEKDINPLTITATLQYSNTPKLIEIESSHDRLHSFGAIDPLSIAIPAQNLSFIYSLIT
ncbi:MAG: hypothetical protein KJP23_24145, partial [Deltaproteobacteria bacterium]|nr:hypothetical protein [Deltaproteobacteria bacterium]